MKEWLFFDFFKIKKGMNINNIDVVIPCFNPSPGWEKMLIEYTSKIEKELNGKLNLIVVNDGSQKGFDQETIDYIYNSKNNTKIISYTANRGKGYALREGVGFCKSNYTIFTDYDCPYTVRSIKEVIETLYNGADIVVATRNNTYRHSLPPFRRFLSIISCLLNRYILCISPFDTQGGLKAFNQKGREIFLLTKIDTFLFDTEFIYLANKINHVKIRQVIVEARNGIKSTGYPMSVVLFELLNWVKIGVHNFTTKKRSG